MAPINYLPGAFPCPRKYMLIYGHTPTPPPPATLTQEQLARDAGQLVQSHAVLDKLVDDTDRSQHSLLSRIQQIADEAEKLNKILERAALNPRAGLVVCVETLKKRCDHHATRYAEASDRVAELSVKITDLRERNKRLHDAQGSGYGAEAELKAVRDVLNTITSQDAQTVLGMAKTVVGMNLNQRTMIQELREQVGSDPIRAALRKVTPCNLTTLGMAEAAAEEIVRLRKSQGASQLERLRKAEARDTELQEAGDVLNKELGITKGGSLPVRIQRLIDTVREGNGSDPALDRQVQTAHRALHDAGVEPRCGTIVERVGALIAERDKLKASAGAIYGVSPTLDERAWEVRNRDNRVMAVCASLVDAQRIRASLEAR